MFDYHFKADIPPLSLRGCRGLAVAHWTQSRMSWVQYCSGASFIKFNLISPSCPRPNSAFIVQKSGLKHRHFICTFPPTLSLSLSSSPTSASKLINIPSLPPVTQNSTHYHNAYVLSLSLSLSLCPSPIFLSWLV